MTLKPVTDMVLDLLENRVETLGTDLLRRGINLVKRSLNGDATEEEMWEWLRAAQGRAE